MGDLLLDGLNHVAVLTKDTDRLVAFYDEVFGATVDHVERDGPFQLTLLNIGGHGELNIFQIEGNTEAERQTPMFGRGRIDHLAVQAASKDAFDEIRTRLMERGASDGFVTDFGPALSVFFIDPDGLECEVVVENPDAQPGVYNAPGTPAPGY